MTSPFRQTEFEAYLDEALPAEEMARVETALRDDAELSRQLAAVIARRDSGLISLGNIWRRHRLSCLARQELGSFLLGVLPEETANYVTFHIEVAGCRYCQANLADLRDQQAETNDVVQSRRHKYYQSSAGYLRRSE